MAEAGKQSRVQGLSTEEIKAGKRNPLPEPAPEPVTPERAYRMGTETERDRNRAESSARANSGHSGGGSRSTVKTVTVSDNQAAITAAFAVIGVIILAKHQWIQKIATWASSAPKAVAGLSSPSTSQAQQQLSPFGITLPPSGASTTIQGSTSDTSLAAVQAATAATATRFAAEGVTGAGQEFFLKMGFWPPGYTPNAADLQWAAGRH